MNEVIMNEVIMNEVINRCDDCAPKLLQHGQLIVLMFCYHSPLRAKPWRCLHDSHPH